MKVAVIGAGWSGLAAAVAAAEQGAQVTLFEAGRVAGGRARGVAARGGFSFLDNGQHLLIADYAAVFGWLQRLGVDVDAMFARKPMRWYMADGLRFQAVGWLPKPLNVLAGLLRSPSFRLPEKAALLKHLAALRWWQWRQLPDQSVAQFLAQHHVSARWREEFWQPIVWGALNTPLEDASLRVLMNVLTDGSGSDLCLTTRDLGEVVVEPALQKFAQLGGNVMTETRVGRLSLTENGILVNQQAFDRVIIAVAPYHLAALLPENSAPDIQAAIQDWRYHAITTVYLRYATAPKLPAMMTGLAYGTAQWLIDRHRLNGSNEIAAVISVSEQHGSLKTEDWVARVHADVLSVAPNVGEPLESQVITEKRATIASSVQRRIPSQQQLNQAGIFLAGDYWHERYPATLEAAVLSGLAAAQNALSPQTSV